MKISLLPLQPLHHLAHFLCCLSLTACVEAPPPRIAPYFQKSMTRQARLPIAPQRSMQQAAMQPWQQLPDWENVNLLPSWAALLQSCRVLRHKVGWKNACLRADQLTRPNNAQVRSFFEAEFIPRQLFNQDGSGQGLVTGYYEPKLKGSYTRTARFRYPLYAVPEAWANDNLSYSLASQRRYYRRADIEAGRADLRGRELFWVENKVDLYFLQIQGSGRIELPNGQLVKVGHAANNGQPYLSVGKKLVEMGELEADQGSMWDIKAWGQQNPQQLARLLNSNPRYVFFREVPPDVPAPIGALGVPLTEGYSIAVDPKNIPMGAPVFLATTYPNSSTPLNRLVFAQDAGIAVKGKVRADFFWGFGAYAETQAARMKQQAQMWVLVPRGRRG